jgi:cytochrome c oxidase cbb3-type subunit III
MSTEPKKTESQSGEDRVIHEVDGIQEYDNQLPNWWLATLFISIVFAVGYFYVYHQGQLTDLPNAAYQKESERLAAEEAKRTGVVTSAALLSLSRDGTKVSEGKATFESTCAACHRADGGGNIGPNLTDGFWLHGGSPENIYTTISKGVADKGMAAWGPQLGSDRVQAVTAYILTLRGTNVAGGKAPQGTAEN